jgi:hypothetical protein
VIDIGGVQSVVALPFIDVPPFDPLEPAPLDELAPDVPLPVGNFSKIFVMFRKAVLALTILVRQFPEFTELVSCSMIELYTAVGVCLDGTVTVTL